MPNSKKIALVVSTSIGKDAMGKLRKRITISSATQLVDFVELDIAKNFNKFLNESAAEWVICIVEPVTLTKDFETFVQNLTQKLFDADVVYADSKSSSGEKIERPIYSPQRLLGHNYMGPVIAFRVDRLAIPANVDVRSDRAFLYALLIASLVENLKISHENSILYRELGNARTSLSAAEYGDDCASILETLASPKYVSSATFDSQANKIIVKKPFDTSALISIVIPTRGVRNKKNGTSLVINAVSSIVKLSTYRNVEFVIIVDKGPDETVLREIEAIAGNSARFVTWEKPFNFSQKMNFGVMHARGDYVLLLNDDVELISPGWLESMLALAQLPNAGMAGAMLYYEDESIQHAGHAYYQGSPTHIGLGLPRGSRGPQDAFLVEREVSGVTAACALMPKQVFLDAGGFTDLLPGNFNDVDLCMKVGWLGRDIYWTPNAELFHYESKTRDAHVHYYELDVIEHRWGLRLDDQRFWRGHPWRSK